MVTVRRFRNLHDPQSEKVWNSECLENRVIMRSGKMSAQKLSEKILDNADAALVYAEKEEWTRLKKGYELSMPGAEPGEPLMHLYLGASHSGSMLMEVLENGQLLVNRYNQNSQHDELIFLTDEGKVAEVLPLPETNSLVWNAKFSRPSSLLLLVDHQVFSYSMQDKQFRKLGKRNSNPASFLCCSGDVLAWYEEPEIVFVDRVTGEISRKQTVKPEKFGGHTLQLKAELSPDSKTLALCCKSGEIMLIDVASGEIRCSLKADFQMVRKLVFSPDGNYLFFQEAYGDWGLYCIDLQQGELSKDFPHIRDTAGGDFAVNTCGKLAVSSSKWIDVIELLSMEKVLRFRVDHAVKSCAMKFYSGQLCVRTDYGCLSLYSV